MNNELLQVPKPDGSSRVILLALIIILLILGSLMGCKTPERMLRKFDKLQAACNTPRTDTVPESWSLREFPTRTKYLPGKPVYRKGKTITKEVPGETVYVNCDSLKDAGMQTIRVKVPCPPNTQTTIVDTLYVHDTLQVVDDRELVLCDARYMGAMDEASRCKIAAGRSDAKAGVYRKWCMILGSALFVLLFILIGGMLGKISNPINWIRK